MHESSGTTSDLSQRLRCSSAMTVVAKNWGYLFFRIGESERWWWMDGG
jgi:hypothetical protein